MRIIWRIRWLERSCDARCAAGRSTRVFCILLGLLWGANPEEDPGVPVVIWSHFSLGNGWEELPNPYGKGYEDGDALKLGTNVLVYALTHGGGGTKHEE